MEIGRRRGGGAGIHANLSRSFGMTLQAVHRRETGSSPIGHRVFEQVDEKRFTLRLEIIVRSQNKVNGSDSVREISSCSRAVGGQQIQRSGVLKASGIEESPK